MCTPEASEFSRGPPGVPKEFKKGVNGTSWTEWICPHVKMIPLLVACILQSAINARLAHYPNVAVFATATFTMPRRGGGAEGSGEQGELCLEAENKFGWRVTGYVWR